MTKWGTYLITGAVVMIVFTYFLQHLISKEVEYVFSPLLSVLTLLLGGTGIILHLASVIKNNILNFSTLSLLTGIMAIIFGISFQNLKIENAKYLILFGALLIAVWIMIPNKAKDKQE